MYCHEKVDGPMEVGIEMRSLLGAEKMEHRSEAEAVVGCSCCVWSLEGRVCLLFFAAIAVALAPRSDLAMPVAVSCRSTPVRLVEWARRLFQAVSLLPCRGLILL